MSYSQSSSVSDGTAGDVQQCFTQGTNIWSKTHIVQFFQLSHYMLRKARHLR